MYIPQPLRNEHPGDTKLHVRYQRRNDPPINEVLRIKTDSPSRQGLCCNIECRIVNDRTTGADTKTPEIQAIIVNEEPLEMIMIMPREKVEEEISRDRLQILCESENQLPPDFSMTVELQTSASENLRLGTA